MDQQSEDKSIETVSFGRPHHAGGGRNGYQALACPKLAFQRFDSLLLLLAGAQEWSRAKGKFVSRR